MGEFLIARSGAAAGPGRLRYAMLALMVLLMGACSHVPRDAPASESIRGGATLIAADAQKGAGPFHYALVELHESAVQIANRATLALTPKFGDLPRAAKTRNDASIHVGDTIGVAIFEASSGGLFIPNEAGVRAGNFIQVPSQQVDGQGFISIPYAGQVQAAGRSAHVVGQEIEHRLSRRAIEPQALVSVNERRGNEVSVLGEVNQPARFTLDPGGETLAGAISRAGSPRYPIHETLVVLQRDGKTYRAALSAILRRAEQNVPIFGGDAIFLSREAKYVLVFGATANPSPSNSRRVTFEGEEMTLAEALAKSNGLADNRADAASVFVFRTETAAALGNLGLDASRAGQPTIPTVYVANLGQAEGIFQANRFLLRHGDVVVAADARLVDLQKIFALIGLATSPVQAGASIAIAAR